jgi:hypothetical protein
VDKKKRVALAVSVGGCVCVVLLWCGGGGGVVVVGLLVVVSLCGSRLRADHAGVWGAAQWDEEV